MSRSGPPYAKDVVIRLLAVQSLTAEELIAETKLTRAAIQSALYLLRREDVLIAVTLDRGRRYGRPRCLYSLREAA